MKKFLLTATAVLMALAMLCGCSEQPEEPSVPSEPSIEIVPDETEEPEEDTSADSAMEAYNQQIERYYTALSEQWSEGTYFEQEMSHMAVYYYEGNALDNVGYAFMDLDGDGVQELIIGGIYNSENDPLVFEVWTLKDGEPVMLVQSGARNRYYSQYTEDDGIWTIANEAENSAANRAVHYLQLSDSKFEVVQGIVFDAMADESAPWFMAYDLDWDVSNDTPIDEDTANDVMDAGRNKYTAIEYIPYSQYK